MSKFKKLIAALSTVTILSTLVVTTAQAATFPDVPSWAEESVEYLVSIGAVDSTQLQFRAGDSMNRAEAVKLLGEAVGLEGDVPTTATFVDVKASEWYFQWVERAYAAGIVNGYSDRPGYFGPADTLTKGQWAKIVVEGSGMSIASCDASIFDDIKADAWECKYVTTLAEAGLVDTSKANFEVYKQVNRAEAAKMLYGVLTYDGSNPVDDDDDTSDDDTVASGDLDFGLSSGSPQHNQIPKNAASVEVLRFDISAGSDPAEIDSITIHKDGVSEIASDFQGYLYEGNNRLTSGKSLNSDSKNIQFNNLNWKLKAGEDMTVSLRVDIGATATSGTVSFSVTDVEAGGDVTGLPVKSATHGLSTTSVGSVTLEKDGTVTDPKVGEQGALIGRFKLTTSGENALVEQLGLYVGGGSINATDLINAELYVSGVSEAVATVDSVNDQDVLNFVFDDPLEIEKGNTKSFKLYADLNTGRSADTVKVYVDEKTDVLVVGDTYGFGMKVDIGTSGTYDGTSCTSSAGSCTYSEVEGGDITISSNGPAASDIAVNGKDVTLMNFSVNSVSDVTFENFEISLTASESSDTDEGLLNATDGTANFTDIKIVDADSGKTLWGPVDADAFKTASGGATLITEVTDAAVAYYKFTDEVDISAGETLNLAIRADVKNDTDLDEMTIVAGVNISSTIPEIRDVNNKVITNSTSLVPSAAIAGKTMTVSSPSLAFAVASAVVSDTFVKGSKDVKFVCFSARASESSSIKITSLTLGSQFDDEEDNSYETDGQDNIALNSIVGSVRIVDEEGAQIAGYASVSSTGTVVFDNFNHTIPAGATELLCVQGDISADAYQGGEGEQVAFTITGTSSVVAEDNDGNTLAAAQKTGLAVNNDTDAPDVRILVSNGGNLTLSVDSSTPKEDIVVAGTSKVAVSTFEFDATDEDFLVTKLSINNRQSATVAAGSVGDYDNNVSSITVEYPKADGTTESKTAFLTNGNAQFSGLNFFVEKDDTAKLTVYANLKDISTGATAGEFVDLAIALNNFEATAQGSGETYKADKIDAGTASLSIGTISYTDGDGSLELDGAQNKTTTTLGTTTTLTIDDSAGDNSTRLPVGVIICIDDDDSAACSSEDVYVITGFAAGTTEDTYTVLLIDDAGDSNYNDNAPILYSFPTEGNFTATNRAHVYETKPTVTLAASSPSGSRVVSAADSAFVFNIAANAKEKVQIRAGVELSDTILDGNGTPCAISTDSTTGDSVDGTSAKCTLDSDGDGDTFAWSTSGTNLSSYARVNFWFQYEVVGGAAPDIADFKILTSTTQTGLENETAFTQAACGADGTKFVTTEWYNCDLAVPTGTDSNDLFFGIEIDESTEAADTDIIYVDEVKFYNEKLTVDVSTDTDIDTYANNTSNAGAPSEALLKEGSTTVATGYWSSVTNGASAATTASATFIPTTAIEISKGTSKTFTVQIDSSDLINEDSGSDDPVSFSIDLGTSSEGTVTAGDFWWYDTNATVKWLGQVANTTLNSNTVTY